MSGPSTGCAGSTSPKAPTNLGTVLSVRGGVVDALFRDRLPPIHSLLRAGAGGEVVIEVLAQRDARHVRGIALTATQGSPAGWWSRTPAAR